jgi:hypothetical protein
VYKLLKGKSKIFKHGKANTLYLVIPSKMATDSNCPFKVGDKVDLSFQFEEKGVYLVVDKNARS